MPDYEALAAFRYQLRKFLQLSEERVKKAGLEPQQHQLLLAVAAHDAQRPSIGWLAERLALRHHSTVGLVDRLVARGLLKRERDHLDQRRVLVAVTPEGATILKALSEFHEQELREKAPDLIRALQAIVDGAGASEGENAERQQ